MAGRCANYPSGAKRAVSGTKEDIIALYFYDYLFIEPDALKGACQSDMKFIFGNVAEGLFPTAAAYPTAGFPDNELRGLYSITSDAAPEDTQEHPQRLCAMHSDLCAPRRQHGCTATTRYRFAS